MIDYKKIKRGDIFKAKMDSGLHNVLVVSNNRGNYHSPCLIVYTLNKDGSVNLNQLNTIDKQRLVSYVDKLLPIKMEHISKIMRLFLMGLYQDDRIAI